MGSETIENKSMMSEEEAMGILEIMKNSQEDSIQPEILELLKNNQEESIQPEIEENEENTIKCSAACKISLKEDNYIDHVLECEAQIEDCWRCGEEYKNNDVHRSLEKHSTPEQRFACMTCMSAHASRLRIADNHRYICMGSGTKKLLVNEKTPEATGEDMQQAYDESNLIKKILKEDFRKRNRKYRKKKKGTNPMRTVITVLSAISLIYLMIFIMMKSTEEAQINTQNEKIIKVGANSENSQNLKDDKINNQNQIKISKPLIEDTIKKKAMKRTIEESIAVIRNQNKCSNQLTNQAIDKFLQQQEKKMEKLILEKLMNLEILQNNRDILENKINIQNKEMEPADIAYPEDGYDPDNIENHNKDQEGSFNLDNVVSKMLELQITRKINKANEKTSGEQNNEYT